MNIENIRLTGAKILCAYPDERENLSAGGIIMPGVKEKPFHMKACLVGDIEEPIKPGDVVVFDQYSGSTIEVGGKEYLSLKEEDIFGVVEQE